MNIKRLADKLLAECRIIETLSQFGDVCIHGSYSLDLMVWPELDIWVIVPPDQPSLTWRIVERLSLQLDLSCVVVAKEEHWSATMLDLRFIHKDVPWKIDLGVLEVREAGDGKSDSPEQREIEGYNAAIGKRLTPELRNTILDIKRIAVTFPQYRKSRWAPLDVAGTFTAKDIYIAVFDEGVSDYAQFADYLKQRKGIALPRLSYDCSSDDAARVSANRQLVAQGSMDSSGCSNEAVRPITPPGRQATASFDRDRLTVSCLCITEGRVPLLTRAIRCFQQQSYDRRELIIVYRPDDVDTKRYVDTLADPSIRAIEAPADRSIRLGGLRQIAVDAATADYVATWDDDDWHSPSRLNEQIAACRTSGKRASVLGRVQLFDSIGRRAFLSERRPFISTLVAERTCLPKYENIDSGEDNRMMSVIMARDEVVVMDRPELYIYVHHNESAWLSRNWQTKIAPFAEPLSESETARISATIEQRAKHLPS